MLENTILMDARLMGKGIGADDGLVRMEWSQRARVRSLKIAISLERRSWFIAIAKAVVRTRSTPSRLIAALKSLAGEPSGLYRAEPASCILSSMRPK